jgi:hypothetical protein
LIWLPVVILLAAGWLAAAPAQTGPDDISVTVQRAESDFPDGIKFFVTASSPDEIDDIRVFFKKLGQSNRSAYRVVEFEPGTEIQGEAVVHSGTRGEFIPPGTRIEYSFEIRDTAGRRLRTDDQVFVYLDQRFDWQTLSDGLITVYYNQETIADRAQAILDTSAATLERMGPILGIDPEHPLHIVTYSNYRDMVDALPFQAQAVSQGLVTQGTAFSNERVLLVLAGQGGYLGTTSHEFTHLLVADASGTSAERVPRWLNEGLAEYGNLRPSPDYDSALERAIRDDAVRPLWFQNTFSGSPDEVIIAYGQGKSVVEYLLTNYDEAKMAELIRAQADTLDIDEALEETYGFNLYELDTQWRASVGLQPSPPPPVRPTRESLPPPTARPAGPVQAPVAVRPEQPESVREESAPGQEERDETPRATPGCGLAPSRGPVPLDPALPLVFAGGLGLLLVNRWKGPA